MIKEDCICEVRFGDTFACSQHGGEGSLSHLASQIRQVAAILGRGDVDNIVRGLETVGGGRSLVERLGHYQDWLDSALALVDSPMCDAAEEEGDPHQRCRRIARYKLKTYSKGEVNICALHVTELDGEVF